MEINTLPSPKPLRLYGLQCPMCVTKPESGDRLTIQLDDVPTTLLIPLCARVAETERADPIVRDPKAVEILAALDYDFSHLRRLWLIQVDIAVRTEIFDEATSRCLAEHPCATVVNLGAGLDGRFWRLDNGQVTWLDLDLPEVVKLRRKFYAESDRNRFIARSILDFTWIDEVERRAGEPLLILVEGVLHYFEEAQVRQLFRAIADRLPGAELLFHSTSPLCVRHQPCSRAFREFPARFHWGIRSGREIAAWDPRYQFLAEWAFVDRHPARWRWVGWARRLPWVGNYFRATMKITHLRFRA